MKMKMKKKDEEKKREKKTPSPKRRNIHMTKKHLGISPMDTYLTYYSSDEKEINKPNQTKPNR